MHYYYSLLATFSGTELSQRQDLFLLQRPGCGAGGTGVTCVSASVERFFSLQSRCINEYMCVQRAAQGHLNGNTLRLFKVHTIFCRIIAHKLLIGLPAATLRVGVFIAIRRSNPQNQILSRVFRSLNISLNYNFVY